MPERKTKKQAVGVPEQEPAVDPAPVPEETPVAEVEPASDVEAEATAAEAPTRRRLGRGRAPSSQPAAAAAAPKRAQREAPKARKPIVRLPKPETERGRRQERRGVVVSAAMDKTIVVKVDTVKAHPRYKKVVRR